MSIRGGGGAIALLLLAVVLLVADLDLGGGEPASSGGGLIADDARVEVVRAVDGDTIEVELESGAVEDVRYIGVDTPETVKPGAPVECFGPEASDFNHGLVDGARARLDFDAELRDDYGRLLAYVYVGDRLVNAELLSGGYARTLEIEPNTAMAERFARLELEASRTGRGLWSAC